MKFLTAEILEGLGFVAGKWKSGMLSDYRTHYFLIEGKDTGFGVMEYEEVEAGTYGGYEVEGSPAGFQFKTVEEMLEAAQKNLSPVDAMTLSIRISQMP